FMKFLNNFINQLTPFFFYAIGGYLVIKGDMTLGALVAALGAFKDLSAPWKSLLTYYNQLQDMSLRYQTIVEQFEMPDNLRAELLDGRPAETPSFAGPVALENVTVLSEDGTPILDALSLEIPAGALAAVQCADPLERDALVQTLSRLHLPAAGRITVNGHDLAAQHQEVIARRIGLVRDTAMLFDGTVGFNFTSAIRLAPPPREQWSEEMLARALEAETVGNCPDPTALSWIDPALAGTADIDGLKAWWLETIEMMGTDGALVRRALDARIDAEEDAELAAGILALRPAFLEALSEAGLAKHIEPFDPKRFHTGLTIFENLLFAVPAERGAVQEEAHEIVAEALERLGYTASFRLLALRLLRSLDRVFADVGPGHPVFRRLPIAADGFQRLAAVYRDSEAVQSRELERLLETVSFSFSAREFPEGVDDQTRDAITRIRCAHGAALRDALGARVSPLVPDAFIAGLTVFQNAIFGKFVGSTEAENSAKQMLADRLEAAGLKGDATITVTEVETGLGGSAMPANARERIAFIRAVLKRPDVLILDRAFVNQEPAQRDRVIQGTKRLLPGVTVIVVEPAIPNPEAYDVVHRIAEGRLVGETPSLGEDSEAEDGALNRKVRALRKTPLFEGLPTGQLHLLAFAADWFSAEPGESVFRVGDAVDGVYVIRKGRGELRVPARGPDAPPVQSFGKGEVIGDVGTLIQSDRRLEMVALAPLRGLKIRKDEYLEIVTHDPIVAKRLLETYAGMIASALIDAEPARG
ncbi:MAG: cyclic nucleotide-binding domain-containing protein, partial [Pseudomonadota bacterium]